MIRKITLLFLAFVLTHFASYAQRSCGFDVKESQLRTDPAYMQEQAEFRARWNAYLQTYNNLPPSLKQTVGTGPDTVYEIPVVVHVLHTGNPVGGKYNPSDADIQAYIDYTNDAWAAAWAGYPTPTTGGNRIPIKFVLAKRDTLCAASNGIVRIDAGAALGNYAAGGINLSGSGGEPELSVKNLSRWNSSLYYNIWVVNKIDGVDGYPGSGTFTAGYAYRPSLSPTFYQIDGTVILASRFDPTPVSAGGPEAGPGDITLPHELGHAFNLLHVFDPAPNASGCPPTANCSITGDEVCDTEPIVSSAFSCPSGINACTGAGYNNTPHNFMDYSNCQDRFTLQQRLRVMYSLKTHPRRASLMTSLGGTAPFATALPGVCITTANNPGNTNNIGPRDIWIIDNVFTPLPDTLMYVVSSGFNGDAIPPATGRPYVDNTCRHMVTLKSGKSYKMIVNVGTSTTTSKAKVFIDYNNDGIFKTSDGEMIMSSTGGPGYKTGFFTVPISATTVMCRPIRMRVIVDSGSPTLNVDSCGGLDNGQAEDYSVTIVGSGGSGAGSVTISNPPIGGNPSCIGTELTFYGVPGTGLTVTGYKWLLNNVIVAGQTTDTFRSTTFVNNDKVKVRLFYTTQCGIDSVTSSEITVIRATSVTPGVTIAIKSGSIPGCIDDTVTFRMSANINPGGAPTYQWQVQVPPSGTYVNVAGATDTIFKAYGYPANTRVRVQMTSSAPAPCALPPKTALSNIFILSFTNKAPTVSIALTVGTNPGCAGQNLTFTATPTVGGTAPTYVWRVNSVVQTGFTGNTFTKILNNGDVVNCTLTSNSPCAVPTTATSNNITIIHQQIVADVSITQTSPAPTCDNHDVTFDAVTVNSGTGPLYQWFLNNVAVGAPGGPTFTAKTVNNDAVKVVFIATDVCVLNATDTSNIIIVDSKKSDTPTVSMKITKGKDPGCIDSLVEFTATAIKIGLNPKFDWFVNGFLAASGNVFSTTSLLTGDVVYVRAHQTDGGCYLPDTVYSESDTMMRSITLDAPVIHLIGNMLTVDRKGSFLWFGPGGQLAGGTTGQYYPTAIGSYFAVANNNGCWSRPSNTLTITLLDISNMDMDGFKVYPNPSNGLLNLDWKGQVVNMDITVYNQVGQQVMHDELKNGSHKVLNLGSMANGIYYVALKDESGKVGTVKISLSR